MITDPTNGASKEMLFFELELGGDEYPITVRLPITIPCNDDPEELAYRVLQHHNLPLFMHKELWQALDKFIRNATNNAECKKAAVRLQKLQKEQCSAIAQYWQKQQTGVEEEEEGCSDSLSGLYHALAHSAQGARLLQLEHQYSSEVALLVRRCDQCLLELETKQAADVLKAVSSGCSDTQVNSLSTEHREAEELARAEWDSAITGLKEQQLRNFRAMLRDGQVAGAAQPPPDGGADDDSAPVMEESFTIHLGTQMKQMHNLRLIAADAVNYCDYDYSQHAGGELPPQRIQTSLQLYGRNLHGLVIMVDNRINSYSGIKKEFGNVCSRATELHFPELEVQLQTVREQLLPAVKSWRARRAAPTHVMGGASPSSADPPSPSGAGTLQPGDVYITRHSNLSGVHVVFHVVVDDSVRGSNITSRHPVILGLRNVLKVACLCDITTLSLPLLLSNALTEDMSVPWCQRRAELVYKCVKGFMMEMTSWGGSEMNTLQFMLPKNISEAQFQSLSAMLPSIFRVSNPLVVTSQAQEPDS